MLTASPEPKMQGLGPTHLKSGWIKLDPKLVVPAGNPKYMVGLGPTNRVSALLTAYH